MILREAIDICCNMADNICIKKINGDNEFEMPMEEWQDALFENDESKSICITSSNAGEGKSWVSANLAISCAQYGKKVLIIDADLRKGRQHRIFKKSNRTGLSDLLKNLRGNITAEDIDKIQEELTLKIQDTDIPNVYLLTSGPVPFNPSELLGSRVFSDFVNAARSVYEYIFIDTPPIGSVIDGAVVAHVCDGVCMVVETGWNSYRYAQKVKEHALNGGKFYETYGIMKK